MPSRVFLDWSLPFLPALADWLLESAPRSPAPDLSGSVVILPTAAAGRRLRELLALKAGPHGLLSPHLITPDVLISWATDALPAPSIAGRGEETAAWASVLISLDLESEEWLPLFPINPVAQDFRWAAGAAADLLKLRRTLEEGGRDLALAASTLGPAHPEAARWQALVRLEKRAVARLESAGWRDSTGTRLHAARHPILPEGTTRVILAGVPDSIHLVRISLASPALQNETELTVITHAPPAMAESFDAWGRPLPEIWTTRDIKLPKGNDTIVLTARPDDAAHAILTTLTGSPHDPAAVAIGSADPEVSAPLRRHAAAHHIDVYDPEGQPLMEHEISWLLKTLTQLLRTGSWTSASQLLRLPDVLAAACRAANSSGHLRALEDWDDFQSERLPQSLSQAAPLARHWAETALEERMKRQPDATDFKPSALPGIIAWFQKQIGLLKQSPLPDALTDFLEHLHGGETFANPADRQRFTAALETWQDALESVEHGARAFLPDLPAADRLELAASLLREKRLYAPHPDSAHALHGWLELPWQEAPDLAIAGMNEGMVPDSLQGDAWLPDSVRGLLDLKTNDTRLARDSYLLTTMIESRRQGGSIRLLAGRMTSAGDPLKPSRLLLRCPLTDLPERALRLFPKEIADESTRPPAAPWHRAWSLKVPSLRPEAPIFQRLSVTAFSDYLKCPFRFYLKHVLKMEAFDPAQAELDARTVGNLFHNTMEEFHKNTDLRDSTDGKAITDFLHGSFDATISEFYGSALTVPVVMQLEVIRNCLAKAAEIHAAESELGWRFEQVEMAFPTLVRIHRTEIRGRIDLIQHHPDFGYRILDYKTASTASKPADAHLKSIRNKTKREQLRDAPNGSWANLERDDKFFAWQNLQLPLYARIMADHYNVDRVGVGYINLPRAVSEAGLAMWENIDSTILDSAWVCAEGIVSSIHQGIFWPPSTAMKYDDFDPFIFQEAESSFDPAFLASVQSMIASGEFQPRFTAP
ncbi:MAG: rexB [Verrucomicrobiales bacterium]|nr:rexB [Verrucomicrobiales bacterium]